MPGTFSIVGQLTVGLFLEMIYAPVWWYTSGFVWFVKKCLHSIRETADSASLGIWVKNLFVPMYGQYDAWGRIVSFIVRFGNIVGRSVWVAIWAFICFAVIIIWIALPPTIFLILLSALIRRTYV